MDGKASNLDAVLKESVDLENIPLEEVFKNLRCSREGLSSSQAEQRLDIFGPNKLEEKKESKFLKFLGFMWNPLSWVMEEAAIMAIALANGGGKPPDWQDFVGIIVLLIINSTISFIVENNAGNAAAALMARLAPKAKVLRNGKWSEEESAILVPGDIISVKLGDIIPADARLLEADPLKIDQSSLTGESLPVTKGPGDGVYSGSTCKQGEFEAVVIATGVHTFFGKAAHLVDSTNQVGHFQKVLTAIGDFCISSIAVGIVIELIVMYPIQHRAYRPGIDNLLVLLIGGIPIAMPTVLSVTMAIGSHRLAQQGAITKRMTAIEEMAVLTSRAIFQRMKNYTIYAVSITIRIVLGFMLLALIWQFDFPPFMVLIIAILNDGTIMTISKDRVKPSPQPDSWKLSEIFATGVVLGSYLAMMTVIFFWAAYKTDFFPRVFHVESLEKTAQDDFQKLAAAVYLQVSTISQALIFVTRSRSWSFMERPGFLLVFAFLVAQLIATLIAVYADWGFATIKGIGWGWAGVIWLYNIVFFLPLDVIKFLIRYAMSGRAWDLVLDQRIAFTRKKDFGREERELKWATAQRTLHGLQPPESTTFQGMNSYSELNQLADEARRRAEIARLRELNTLKGRMESVVRQKGLDLETIQQSYTV